MPQGDDATILAFLVHPLVGGGTSLSSQQSVLGLMLTAER